MSFWDKITFMLRNGFWPDDYHCEMVDRLMSFQKNLDKYKKK